MSTKIIPFPLPGTETKNVKKIQETVSSEAQESKFKSNFKFWCHFLVILFAWFIASFFASTLTTCLNKCFNAEKGPLSTSIVLTVVMVVVFFFLVYKFDMADVRAAF
jgi:Kef-type K+ transport system membrane component KefB